VRIGLRACWVSWLVLSYACLGGQSGTETPSPFDSGPPPAPDADVWVNFTAVPCPCALAGRNALVHARLIELTACEVRATVVEVLDAAPGVALAFEPGDEVMAVRRGADCGTSGLEVGSGDDALLVLAQDAANGAADEALVATWGEQHAFGTPDDTGLALPADERHRLLDPTACARWFGEQGARARESDALTAPVCEGAAERR
jgi:hypothetical protein